MRAFPCENCGTMNILTKHLWNKHELPCETRCGKCGTLIDTGKPDEKKCGDCEHYLGETGCREQSYHEIHASDPANEHCEDRYEPRRKRGGE